MTPQPLGKNARFTAGLPHWRSGSSALNGSPTEYVQGIDLESSIIIVLPTESELKVVYDFGQPWHSNTPDKHPKSRPPSPFLDSVINPTGKVDLMRFVE